MLWPLFFPDFCNIQFETNVKAIRDKRYMAWDLEVLLRNCSQDVRVSSSPDVCGGISPHRGIRQHPHLKSPKCQKQPHRLQGRCGLFFFLRKIYSFPGKQSSFQLYHQYHQEVSTLNFFSSFHRFLQIKKKSSRFFSVTVLWEFVFIPFTVRKGTCPKFKSLLYFVSQRVLA